MPAPAGAARKHPHGRGEDGGLLERGIKHAETPPRAWGRLLSGGAQATHQRNTPTGVGKTITMVPLTGTPWKHPHGRGEDNKLLHSVCVITETPPRAWGRRQYGAPLSARFGNTPTGVGKTPTNGGFHRLFQKHPHGRGEDLACLTRRQALIETPPRAWGRPASEPENIQLWRNTPTGVGKTGC